MCLLIFLAYIVSRRGGIVKGDIVAAVLHHDPHFEVERLFLIVDKNLRRCYNDINMPMKVDVFCIFIGSYAIFYFWEGIYDEKDSIFSSNSRIRTLLADACGV